MLDMWRDGIEGKACFILIATSFLLVPVVIWYAIAGKHEWEAFAAAHECKVVGRISPSTSTGLGFGLMPNGQMGTVMTTSTTPSKTGYACNDGVTYWR